MRPLSNNRLKININDQDPQFKPVKDYRQLTNSNNKYSTINSNPNYLRKLRSLNNISNNTLNNSNANNTGKIFFTNKIFLNKQNEKTNNNPLDNAFMIIRTELRKKNEKIRQLELKLSELEKQYNLLTGSNINNNLNKLYKISLTNNINKNYTFCRNNFNSLKSTSPQVSPKSSIKNSNNINTNFLKFSNDNSPNYYNNVNYVSDSEHFDMKKFNRSKNIELSNDSKRDNSLLTMSNCRIYSKGEVKLFLKEVKSRVNPIIFKEFIQNVKLLTTTKNNSKINKKLIVENVKVLFGEEFKDWFVKFGSIIGINN